jgi:hypothetical protein
VAPITPKGYWDSGWCLLLELPKGTIYQGTPFFKISIFVPLYIFFGIFFYKIGIYDPDLIWGLYFWAVTQWEGGRGGGGGGGVVFLGARLFHYGGQPEGPGTTPNPNSP